MPSIKETILSSIRKGLMGTNLSASSCTSAKEEHIFVSSLESDKAIAFAKQFTKQKGKFCYCESKEHCIQQLKEFLMYHKENKIVCTSQDMYNSLSSELSFQDNTVEALKEADIAITNCYCLVARTGSICITSDMLLGRTASVYTPIHICIAYTSQIYWNISDIWNKDIKNNSFPSMMTFISGPSKTGDIEKTLVVGVHGPKDIYCFLIDTES